MFSSLGKARFYSVAETFLTTTAFLSTSVLWPALLPGATFPQTLFKNRLSCMKKHHNVILVLSAHLPSRHLQKTVDGSSVSPGLTEVRHFLLRHAHLSLATQDPPTGQLALIRAALLGKVPTPLCLSSALRFFPHDTCSKRSVLRTRGNLWSYYASFGR